MGSVAKFTRPRPLIRIPQKPAAELDSRAAQNSLFILVGSFFVTALVMCGVVIAMVCRTWTDVVWMSALVFVFGVAKIGFADALIYVMVRADGECEKAMAAAHAAERWRLPPFRREPQPLPARAAALKLAPGHPQPGSPGLD